MPDLSKETLPDIQHHITEIIQFNLKHGYPPKRLVKAKYKESFFYLDIDEFYLLYTEQKLRNITLMEVVDGWASSIDIYDFYLEYFDNEEDVKRVLGEQYCKNLIELIELLNTK